MKKLVGLLFVVTILGFVGVQAKCINQEHVLDGPKHKREKSKTYQCRVKALEKNNFTKGETCINCGCAKSMHDNSDTHPRSSIFTTEPPGPFSTTK